MFGIFKKSNAHRIYKMKQENSDFSSDETTEPEVFSDEDPKRDPNSLWTLLREAGITEEQLADAYMKRKQNKDKLFGMTLVDEGVISDDFLEFMLEKQKALKNQDKDSFAKVIKMVTEKNSEAVEIQKDIQACAYRLTDALKAKG